MGRKLSFMKTSLLLALALSLSLAAGAQPQTTPTPPPERQLNTYDVSMAVEMRAALVKSYGQIQEIPAEQAWVRGIFTHLLGETRRSDVDFRLHYVPSKKAESLGLPDGEIIVTAGLLKEISTPSTVAFVLAQEMAHLEMAHLHDELENNRREWDLFVRDPQRRVFYNGRWVSTGREPLAHPEAFARNLILHSYGETQDYEADEMALNWMLTTGYSGAGALSTLKLWRDKAAYFEEPRMVRHFLTADQRYQKMLATFQQRGYPMPLFAVFDPPQETRQLLRDSQAVARQLLGLWRVSRPTPAQTAYLSLAEQLDRYRLLSWTLTPPAVSLGAGLNYVSLDPLLKATRPFRVEHPVDGLERASELAEKAEELGPKLVVEQARRCRALAENLLLISQNAGHLTTPASQACQAVIERAKAVEEEIGHGELTLASRQRLQSALADLVKARDGLNLPEQDAPRLGVLGTEIKTLSENW